VFRPVATSVINKLTAAIYWKDIVKLKFILNAEIKQIAKCREYDRCISKTRKNNPFFYNLQNNHEGTSYLLSEGFENNSVSPANNYIQKCDFGFPAHLHV